MPRVKSSDGVLALDLGTSSVRAVVYDVGGAMVEPTLCDLPYKVRTAESGEASSDPDSLVRLIAESIDGALAAARKHKIGIVAAGVSCYWHSLMGVDRSGRPTTELITWADTRSAPESARMRGRFDERTYHARTGCFFHASYWPAKLRWLRQTRPSAVRRTPCGISPYPGAPSCTAWIVTGACSGAPSARAATWSGGSLTASGSSPRRSSNGRPAHSHRTAMA